MGQIVGAYTTVHAPQLFTRPPSEVPEQMDADVAAMKVIADDIKELKPDAVIILGSDHLETFFLSSVPTFAVIAGEYTHAHFANKSYKLKTHLPLAEDILAKLVGAEFDMAYSQDAVLGHSFAAVYEWIIGDTGIPVVPIFINAPAPSAHAQALHRPRARTRQDHRRTPGARGPHWQRRYVALPRHLEVSTARL